MASLPKLFMIYLFSNPNLSTTRPFFNVIEIEESLQTHSQFITPLPLYEHPY